MKEYNTTSELSTIPQLKIPNIIIQYAKESLSTPILLCEHENGNITKIVGKKRGNATYNFHMTAKMNLINKMATSNLKVNLKENKSNTLFLTLTTKYTQGDIDSSLLAMERIKKRLPVFLKNVKNNFGDFNYIWCMECHKNGGCHIHIILQFVKKMFSFFRDKMEKFRTEFNDIFKRLWKIGNIDCQGVMNDNGVFNYVSKEIGKSQNVENALQRLEKRQELKKNDSNKIWMLGLAKLYKKLNNKNIRFLGMSKFYKVSDSEIKEEKQRLENEYLENKTNGDELALIKYMNKSENNMIDYKENVKNYNENENNKIVRYIMIGKNYAKKNLKYFYKSGTVKDNEEYLQCKKILDNYAVKVYTDKVNFQFNRYTRNLVLNKDSQNENDNKTTA